MSRKHHHAEHPGPSLDLAAERGASARGQRLLAIDPMQFRPRQGTVAPRAEPSTNGANQWTGGRRNKHKAH